MLATSGRSHPSRDARNAILIQGHMRFRQACLLIFGELRQSGSILYVALHHPMIHHCKREPWMAISETGNYLVIIILSYYLIN